MRFFRILTVAAICGLLAPCEKNDCNCTPPPVVDAPEGTWMLNGVTYHSDGHAAQTRDGKAYVMTFTAETAPGNRPSRLQLFFGSDPHRSNTFRVTGPDLRNDSNSVSIHALRGSDSTLFTSRQNGSSLTSYVNTQYALTWIVNGLTLWSGTDSGRLSVFLSE